MYIKSKHLDRIAYDAHTESLVQRWNSLGEERQRLCWEESKLKFQEWAMDNLSSVQKISVRETQAGIWDNIVQRYGDQKLPVSASAIMDEIKSEINWPEGARAEPGFTRYESKLRVNQLQQIYVEDKGRQPKQALALLLRELWYQRRQVTSSFP